MTEAQLLQGLYNRSEDAFAYLYRHVLPEVKNYIRRNNGDDDDAKDVFQDAIISFMRNLDQSKYNHVNLQGYLMVIVRNKWLDKVDKANKIVKMELVPDQVHEDRPVEISTAPRLGDYMRERLSRLGEPCRTLILATVVDRKRMEEMALRLGYASAHSARQQKLQCLKKLRSLVDARIITGLS